VSIARTPLVLALALATLGCRVYSAGLATDAAALDFTGLGPWDSGGDDEGKVIDARGDVSTDAGAKGETADLAPAIGDPNTVGCSDGTREGFHDMANWPNIAGCAGGWTSSGLLTLSARQPLCNRLSGNDSGNPNGDDCSAADLCADGWHACVDGPDVARSSPTGCESVGWPGDQAFFAVMTGASAQGVCYDDPSATNDLHGCGSIGQPESDWCPPLTRRMGFADCLAAGVWQCGTVDDNLDEASVVTKTGPSLGGILCCRN
jgi:hypothetical protein